MAKRGARRNGGPKPMAKAQGKVAPKKQVKKPRQKRVKPVQKQQAKPPTPMRKAKKVKVNASKKDFSKLAKPLRVFEGQFTAAKNRKCVGEQNVPCTDLPGSATSQNLITRALYVIDEFIWRASILKPSLFACKTQNDPSIGYQQLRGIWLYALQYYLWKCGCVNGAGAASTGYGEIQIPYGLAKAFQQFAPYTCPITGTTLRNQITPLGFSINTLWFSIDANESVDPLTTGHLGSPLHTYLIHPSSRTAANLEMIEFGTAGNVAIGTFASNYVDFDTYYKTSSFSSLLAQVNTIFKGTIKVDDIPRCAPDASAYTFVFPSGVGCPVPNFRADMGVILGRGRDVTGANEGASMFPYDEPLPVVRSLDVTNVETGPNSPQYFQTLRQVYAYVTSHSSKWVAGSAIGLVNSTKCFTDLKEYSVRCEAFDITKFARKVFNIITSDNWNQTYTPSAELQNTMFAMCNMAFTALFTRIFKSSSCFRTGDPNTNSAFYVMSQNAEASRMPSAICAIINGVGPVKVGGRLVLHRLYNSIGGYVGINTPTAANNRGWTNTISTTGVWSVNSPYYGFGSSVTPLSSITLTLPGTSTPVTRTDVAGTVYSSIMCLKFPQLTEYYQNKLPDTFVSDSLPSGTNEICGNLPCSLICVQSQILGTQPTWQNSIMQATGQNVPGAIVGSYCMNNDDVLHAFINNCIANPPNPGGYLYATRVVLPGMSGDPSRAVQLALNSAPQSQYQAYERALQANNAKRVGGKKNRSQKDIISEVTSKQMIDVSQEIFPSVNEPGSGERHEATKSIGTLVKNSLANATKERICAVAQTYSGANLSGSGQQFVTQYVAEIAPHVATTVVNGVIDFAGDVASTAFSELLSIMM